MEGHLSLLQRDGKFQQRLRSRPSLGLRGEGLWPMKVDGGKVMKNREKAAWFPVTLPTFRKERGHFLSSVPPVSPTEAPRSPERTWGLLSRV